MVPYGLSWIGIAQSCGNISPAEQDPAVCVDYAHLAKFAAFKNSQLVIHRHSLLPYYCCRGKPRWALS